MKKVALVCLGLSALLGCGEVDVNAVSDTGMELDCTHKQQEKDILVASIGASTTLGVAFWSEQTGEILANNRHMPLFASFVDDTFKRGVDYMNLAVGGKIASEIRNEQLPAVLEQLPNYKKKRVVVTIEAGGNDLLRFTATDAYNTYCTSADPQAQGMCLYSLNAYLDANVSAHLDAMMSQIRAADKKATIMVTTQWVPTNAISALGTACVPEAAKLVYEGAIEGNIPELGFKGLNVRIRELAAKYDAKVVEIGGYIMTQPADVQDALLSSDCIHLSGTWDGIPGAIPGDTVGAGYATMLELFKGTFLE